MFGFPVWPACVFIYLKMRWESLCPRLSSRLHDSQCELLPTWSERTTIRRSQSSKTISCVSVWAGSFKPHLMQTKFSSMSHSPYQTGRGGKGVPQCFYLLDMHRYEYRGKMLNLYGIRIHPSNISVGWYFMRCEELCLRCILEFHLHNTMSCRIIFFISAAERQKAHTCTGEETVVSEMN